MLARRVLNYAPAQLDQLCASGELVWVGAALTASRSSSARTPRCSAGPDGAESPEGEIHDRIRETLGRSAQFWFDLVDEVGVDPAELLPALWEPSSGRRGHERRLDAASRRSSLRRPSAGATPAALLPSPRATAITATQGRWSLTDRLFVGERDRRASQSSSSSGRGSSPGTAPRASPGAIAPSTASSRHWRRLGLPGAGTSSKASVVPSSRSAAPSSGSAS